MKTRTSCPKNNKYYIRTVNGGYNGAVLGKPVVSGANVLCNCVGYANGRFAEIQDLGYIKYQLVCNAENFIEKAKRFGLTISSTPIQGGIMVWQKGSTLNDYDGAGHVAVVEEVYDDGTILTSESGWNSWAFKRVHRDNNNNRWGQASSYKFRGCIVNPGVKDPKVIPAPPLVIDGVGGANTVRAMQRFFGTPKDGVLSGQNKTWKKHYPALTAVEFGKGGSTCVKKLQKWLGVGQDGVIGPNTVKAWQKKLGVKIDGNFGPASMKAWQKYLNEHDKATYPPAPTKTPEEKILDACKAQAEWMKNYTYKWQAKPTIEKSKKYGTCVTYVACVLQRLGYLAPGECIWHTSAGKVYGTTDKMTVTYYEGKTIYSLKNTLKAGDILLVGKKSVTQAGDSGSHIFIFAGNWSGKNPYIWDNHSATNIKKGKAGVHTYSGSTNVIAVVRTIWVLK